jgi:type IV pilus assembly protein PilM
MNVGASVTNLNIVRNGAPLFTRDVWIAGNTIIEQIQKRLNLDREKAHAALLPSDDDTPPELAEIVATICEDLAVGVERSVAFLKTSGDAEKIDRIVITGGSSRIPGLIPTLSERHGVPVEVGNCLARIVCADTTLDDEAVSALAPQLAVAVGLALRTR